MIQAITERLARSRRSQTGFTLIELLVVIIVLGVLSAVVVFAVRGTGDKGRGSAMSIDARTIRTAQEAYCAKNGRYGSAEELVADKFLSEMPTYHQTDTTAVGTPTASGNCVGAGDPSRGAFVVTCTEAQTGCGAGGALKLGWRAQSPPAGFATTLNDLSFVNNQRGWVVGGTSTLRILTTGDGGVVWTEVVTGIPGSRALHRLDCVDATHCWAVGVGGTIIRTIDGVNWTLPPNPLPAAVASNFLRGVDFLDTVNGWAVGNGTILRTVDGGDNWTEAFPSIPASLRQVYFQDASNGWAVGSESGTSEAVVYRTTTGGGAPADWARVGLGSVTALADVDFIDTLRGWVVAAGGLNFATVDGGVTWTEKPITCGNRASVEFVNARQGWSVGSTGCSVSATVDGAASWVVQAAPPPVGGLNGVDMLDSAHGWAVGGGGRIRFFGPVP